MESHETENKRNPTPTLWMHNLDNATPKVRPQ